MIINQDKVREVAKLAKLEFEDEEMKSFAKEMDTIVEMVETLDKLDTTGVPATYHGLVQKNVWREDKAEKGTNRDDLFKNVKTHKDGYIEVPAMLDTGESGA